MNSDSPADMPRAREIPRRFSWAWLITLAAIAFATWLGYQAWVSRGTAITIELTDGYGLRPGDPVKHKGIVIGQVRTAEMTDDLNRVEVTVMLSDHAGELARAGARFWVVRPRLGATGIAGLETVVGPRYLAMLPGSGARQRHFVGLDEPPVVDRVEDGDLEIILESQSRGGIRAGAPVTYRQIQVGTVLSVGLSSDGASVESRVHIEKAFTGLITDETRFWRAGGIDARFGLSGASVQVESLESLLSGGVSLATPPGASTMARTGRRFALVDAPKEEWLGWRPFVAIGSSFLPPGSSMPAPVRAVRGWESGRWFKSSKSRRGWLLPTKQGLLGPKDMLVPGTVGDQGQAVLEVAGSTIALTKELAWSDNLLGLLPVHLNETAPLWDASRISRLDKLEDCIIVGDPAAPPIPLATTRLIPEESVWRLDSTVPLDETWHGACVLNRADGTLIGLIVMNGGEAQVALMPASWPPK